MLVVTTTDTDQVDALGTGEFGVGSLTAKFKLSLLAVVSAFGTGG